MPLLTTKPRANMGMNGLRVVIFGEAFFLVPHHELVEPVLRLLARCVLGAQPRPDLAPELGLPIPADALAGLAGPRDLRQVAVVRLKHVALLAERAPDLR